jgi:hypothetical protein
MPWPFSLPFLPAARLSRALQKSRQREPRKDRAAEEGSRLVAGKIVQASYEIVDAALAQRSGGAFELGRRIVNEAGHLGQLLLDFVGGSMYRTRDAADLICSGLLLLLRNSAGAFLYRDRGGIERRLYIFGGR